MDSSKDDLLVSSIRTLALRIYAQSQFVPEEVAGTVVGKSNSSLWSKPITSSLLTEKKWSPPKKPPLPYPLKALYSP